MTTQASIYCRKSTADEGERAEEGHSVEVQATLGLRFAEQHGWPVDPRHVYKQDKAVSGAIYATRGGLQALLRAADARAFSIVIVADLSRLGRDTEGTRAVLARLAGAGVTVWSLATGRPVELETFEGGIMTDIETRFGQWYRDTIRKKTKDAMHEKARRGEVTGPPVFGFKIVEQGGVKTYVVSEPEMRVVKTIFTKRSMGLGTSLIAQLLNKRRKPAPRGNHWSSSTVKRILVHPMFRGTLRYGVTEMAWGRQAGKDRRGRKRDRAQLRVTGEPIEHPRPDLLALDPALVAAVDRLLAEGTERYKENKARGRDEYRVPGTYLLTGIMRCPTCGASFSVRYGRKSNRRALYICGRRREGCKNKLSLPQKETDLAVLNLLEGEVLSGNYIRELLAIVESAPEDEGERLRAELERVTRERDNLVESLAAGVPAASIAGAVKAREDEMQRLKEAIARPRPVAIDRKRLKDALEQRRKEWRTILHGEPAVARALVTRLIGKIDLAEVARIAANRVLHRVLDKDGNTVRDADGNVEWIDTGLVAGVPEWMRKDAGQGGEGIGPADTVFFAAELKPGHILDGLIEDRSLVDRSRRR